MKRYGLLILALLAGFSTPLASAKGNFTYLSVKGPGLTGDLTVTNPALTADFFAFADFSKGEVDAPADPGEGYQIIRVYVENNKDVPFDLLHYYPYTGFVYYDGLVDGSSEYDKKWYNANPSAKEPFLSALEQRARLTWYPFAALVVILAVFFFMYRRKQ